MSARVAVAEDVPVAAAVAGDEAHFPEAQEAVLAAP
jgi:hypothetical protein